MDFEQHFQSQGVRLGGEVGAFFLRQTGGDEQYGVRACDMCLQQLVFVDDEVFSQDRNVDQRTCRTDVPQRTAEEFLIRKDGDGGSACRLVCGWYFVGFGRLVYPTLRGRAPLELGNDSRGRGSQRTFHAAAWGRGIFH